MFQQQKQYTPHVTLNNSRQQLCHILRLKVILIRASRAAEECYLPMWPSG